MSDKGYDQYRIMPRPDGGWAVEWRENMLESWDTLPRKFLNAEEAIHFANTRVMEAGRGTVLGPPSEGCA